MFKQASIILVLLLSFYSLSVAQLPQPQSFYDFEEGEGIDVADQGSAENHGKLFGDAIDWNTGGIVNELGDPDGCIEFIGNPYTELSFVEIPYADFHYAPNYTYVAWVQWLSDVAFGYVFWQDGDTWPVENPRRHVDLWWEANVHGMASALYDSSGNYAVVLKTVAEEVGVDVFDGDWHLVGISLEDNRRTKLWIDGKVIADSTSEVPIAINDDDDLWLGARPNDANLSGCVKMIGLMDRVRIWDVALSEGQMDFLYRSEGPGGSIGPLPEPLSFYDFEEGEGIDVADEGSAENHGKLFGDAIDWNTGGIVENIGDPDGCIEFIGNPYTELSFVEIPYVDFHYAPNYTYVAWVQWLSDVAFGYVFWQDGDTWPVENPRRHVDLWWEANVHGMASALYDSSGNYAVVLKTVAEEVGVDVFDGDWHLVGISLEDNRRTKLWIDGKVIADSTSEVPIAINDDDDLWLGARPNDANLSGCVKMIGLMDRVRIWDEALSESQMTYLYRSEGPGGAQGLIPDPLSFYDFEEGEGIDVADQGSAENHGKLFGDAIDWNTGGIVENIGDPDGCIEFIGNPYTELSFVEIPYADFHYAPNYTYVAWVQWLSDVAFGYVFWQDGDTWPVENPRRHVDLWWEANVHGMASALYDSSGNYAVVLKTVAEEVGVDVFDGDWHLVGISLEDNRRTKLWVDGFVIADSTSEVPIAMNDDDDLWLGARPNDANLSGCVKMIGLMDRVRIWDEALTEIQMVALYQMEGPGGGTSIAENVTTPNTFELRANYPNPFNPTTTITYSLDRGQIATLAVYDLLGHKVRTLTSGVQTAGEHKIQWNGTNEAGKTVSSGVYFYRLNTVDRTETRKMMLLR